MEKCMLSKRSTVNDFEQGCVTARLEMLCQALPTPHWMCSFRLETEEHWNQTYQISCHFENKTFFHCAFLRRNTISEDWLAPV